MLRCPSEFAREVKALNQLRMAERLQPEIDATQVEILRRAWEIQQLGNQIQSNQQMVVSLNQYQPAAEQTALKKNIGDIQGGAGQATWVQADPGGIPALSAVTSDIATLKSQLDDVQNKIQSVTKQRTDLLTQSDQLSQQAEQTHGDKGVELFKKAVDSRKQSEQLSVQIDENNVKLSRLQADLATAQGQQAALEAAAKDFSDKADQSNTAWNVLQKQITALQAVSKAILGDESQTPADADPTGGATIASKAAKLNTLIAANRAKRNEAQGYLNAAAQFFGDAVSLAEQLQGDLATKLGNAAMSPDAMAWKEEQIAMSPGRYQLEQSNAQLHLAQLASGRATEAGAAQRISTGLSRDSKIGSVAAACRVTR